jgi:arylsulfatase A-like enzyme
MRRTSVTTTALALAGTLLGIAGTAPAGAVPDRLDWPPAPTRPNIVVVMADDMRADDLRFMPHVRRLVAARGLAYENSFSPYPLCCPARASFLTGQYAHNHGVLDNAAPYGFGGFDDSATVATSLRAAGYRTAFVGKYLNDYGLEPSRVTGEPSATFVPAGWSDWHGLLQVPYPEGAGTYHYFHPVLNHNGTVASYEGEYQTTLLGRVARDVVRRSAGDRPFFLYLSTLAPHDGLPHEPDDVDHVRRDDGVDQWFPTPARPAWVRGRADALVVRSPGIPASGEPEADVTDKPRSVQAPPLNAAEVEAEARG